MYMDVNSQHWQLLDQAVTDRGHAVYHTLQQIYSRRHSAVSTLKRSSSSLLLLQTLMMQLLQGIPDFLH